jgi:hypothetical protein
MANELPAELGELAWRQRGVLTSSQAIGGGMTKDMLRSRVRHGRWQRLHTGVYLVFSGEPDQLARQWAAVLRAGPGAMLSFRTAAELAGLTGPGERERPTGPAEPAIHVTVPGSRRISRVQGTVLHWSDRAAQAMHPARTPPQTRVEETVLDLANVAATIDDAYGWVARAVGRRLTTEARLREAMELRGRLRWRGELTEALAAGGAGVHSVLEHRYLRDVERPHRLPRGVRQARARSADGGRTEYRDVLYEAYLVAVELDGQAAHPGERRWPDIYRDNAAATAGVLTLRYGWLDVTRHPCRVAAQVAEVLRLRGYAGGRPCSAGCQVATPPAQPHRAG